MIEQSTTEPTSEFCVVLAGENPVELGIHSESQTGLQRSRRGDPQLRWQTPVSFVGTAGAPLNSHHTSNDHIA